MFYSGTVRPRFPLVFKIAIAAFLVVLSVLLFVGHAVYQSERQQLTDHLGTSLVHIARTAAVFVDGDTHETIAAPGDHKSAAFVSLRHHLERIAEANDLKEDQIYTLRPSGEKLAFVVMLQKRTFIGDLYTPPPLTKGIIENVLRTGTPAHTPLYQDENGTFLSGYAPIRDRSGKVVAILEVDCSADRFLQELWRNLRTKFWLVPAALVLALLLSALVARSITKALSALVAGTEAVQRGLYDHRVEVITHDELRTLADSFNTMLLGLRERFAMLRFLPRHTRAVIAEGLKGEQAAAEYVARKREVAVLFSDIRGFTALSDGMSAERVIAMLNIYLRAEAVIIEAAAGSVDKFIGDAVMAIFEGPDRVKRAIQAAQAIQKEIQRLNREGAFEKAIAVGIGISDGEVVMGSVGYEERMEFAVIGSIVNLASRLTSVARGGEIVVSKEAYLALPTLDGIQGRWEIEEVGGLRLKGFAAEMTCYRFKENHSPGASSPSVL